jgi:hypothetical protein
MRRVRPIRPSRGLPGDQPSSRTGLAAIWLLLLLLLLACSDGSSGGSGSGTTSDLPERLDPPGGAGGVIIGAPVLADGTAVLVYGDSLWDVGADPHRCDLCAYFPDDVRFTNYAAAGAEIWPKDLCDGMDPLGYASPTDDPDCRNGIDRALPLPLHSDPALDECAAQVAGRSTCIRDNADEDVLLVQFGTNDVRSVRIDDDVLWQERALEYEESLDLILEARPPGMACVLVVPPPIWSEGFDVYNARLDELADILYAAADAYTCEVADLFGLYMQIESDEGPGATLPLYGDCQSQGSATGDCVHYAVPHPSIPADEILDAIDRAVGFGG